MADEIKERLGHLPSTLTGVGVLAFLGLAVYIKPELLSEPTSFMVLAGGLYALFVKGK
jgi:hypothetical protein